MTQNGIAGYGDTGVTESIVVNYAGGYVDDVDRGTELLYTGEGGRDAATGRQVRPQTLTKGNLGLDRARQQGIAIRVCRQTAGGNYRYDGLYKVTECIYQLGVDGHMIYRFRLQGIPGQISPAAMRMGE